MNKRPGVQKSLSTLSTWKSFAASYVSFHLVGHNKESSAMFHLRVLVHMEGNGHLRNVVPHNPRGHESAIMNGQPTPQNLQNKLNAYGVFIFQGVSHDVKRDRGHLWCAGILLRLGKLGYLNMVFYLPAIALLS